MVNSPSMCRRSSDSAALSRLASSVTWVRVRVRVMAKAKVRVRVRVRVMAKVRVRVRVRVRPYRHARRPAQRALRPGVRLRAEAQLGAQLGHGQLPDVQRQVGLHRRLGVGGGGGVGRQRVLRVRQQHGEPLHHVADAPDDGLVHAQLHTWVG